MVTKKNGICFMLNRIKANPFAYLIWLSLTLIIHVVLFKSRVNTDYHVLQRVLIAVVSIAVVLYVHELFHFIFMKIFGKGSAKIKVMKSPVGLPALGTVSDDIFKKMQLIIIYSAPFFFLTLLPDIIFVFCESVELIFFVISVCNCAGCFFDVIDIIITANKKDKRI